MKKYIKPELTMVTVAYEMTLLAESGGLATGAAVGNEYNGSDVTYSRDGGSLWDDEE